MKNQGYDGLIEKKLTDLEIRVVSKLTSAIMDIAKEDDESLDMSAEFKRLRDNFTYNIDKIVEYIERDTDGNP